MGGWRQGHLRCLVCRHITCATVTGAVLPRVPHFEPVSRGALYARASLPHLAGITAVCSFARCGSRAACAAGHSRPYDAVLSMCSAHTPHTHPALTPAHLHLLMTLGCSLRPNAQFLTRLIGSTNRTNARIAAEEEAALLAPAASKASLTTSSFGACACVCVHRRQYRCSRAPVAAVAGGGGMSVLGVCGGGGEDWGCRALPPLLPVEVCRVLRGPRGNAAECRTVVRPHPTLNTHALFPAALVVQSASGTVACSC
jgi:hypothetical protein